MIKESSLVSDQYLHNFPAKITIQQETKTSEATTRPERRFGGREVSLFCCFSLFEARLHIYWFMIMETWNSSDFVRLEAPSAAAAAPSSRRLQPQLLPQLTRSTPRLIPSFFILFHSQRAATDFYSSANLLFSIVYIYSSKCDTVFFCFINNQKVFPSIIFPCRLVVVLRSIHSLQSSESSKPLVLQPRQ